MVSWKTVDGSILHLQQFLVSENEASTEKRQAAVQFDAVDKKKKFKT